MFSRGSCTFAVIVAEGGPRGGALMLVGKWERSIICERTKLGIGWMQEGKAIALGIKGTISITPFSEFKGCFFVDTKEKVEWLQDQGTLKVEGDVILLRKWSPRENSIILGKFRHGWLELRGLPFHLWNETKLSFILQKWGSVTKVARETLKLMDLSKARVWVEMNPKVVLPTVIEVKDGEWVFTVTVTIPWNEEGKRFQMTELIRFREESRIQGGGSLCQALADRARAWLVGRESW